MRTGHRHFRPSTYPPPASEDQPTMTTASEAHWSRSAIGITTRALLTAHSPTWARSSIWRSLRTALFRSGPLNRRMSSPRILPGYNVMCASVVRTSISMTSTGIKTFGRVDCLICWTRSRDERKGAPFLGGEPETVGQRPQHHPNRKRVAREFEVVETAACAWCPILASRNLLRALIVESSLKPSLEHKPWAFVV